MSKYSYEQAGVDLEAARELTDRLAQLQQRTETRGGLFEGFGGFSAALELGDYRRPVLLATCDGVGTKLKLLLEHREYRAAGRDLVAMNVNDILTSGGSPLLFLDYVGVPDLDPAFVESLVEGIAEACEECECILGGGETAEMPGVVPEDTVELSGFCVGVVERDRLDQRPEVAPGDAVLGIPSRGFHANGFTLIRSILRQEPGDFPDPVVRSLLTPTQIYYQEVRRLMESEVIPSAMAHVTGGGIRDNLSRVLPEGLGAALRIPPWDREEVRAVLQHVDVEEALSTFNMGVGWILVLPPERVEAAEELLPESHRLGEVRAGTETVEVEVEPRK